ncbi:unnamed protein product, partial [Aureobasidium pullulans]
MPSKRRLLASPPRHGLYFNFDLDTNALPPPSVTRDRGAPPGTKSFSRDITLYKPEIAKAAQIEFSEPSDQTKAIMRYAIERPAIDRTLASISEPRLYSEGGISRAITATAADLAVEAGVEHNNNKRTLDPPSGEVPDARLIPVATVMTAKNLRQISITTSCKRRRGSNTIILLRSQPGPEVNILPRRLMRLKREICKQVVMTADTLLELTPARPSARLLLIAHPHGSSQYSRAKPGYSSAYQARTLLDSRNAALQQQENFWSGTEHLIYSRSRLFVIIPPNFAKLLSALQDFKGLLSLLLEKLRGI